MFDPVDPKQRLSDMERAILAYWREEDVFKRSIRARKEQGDGTNRFSFYDGPPFATGLPHYGHLLAGTIKDVIPRYQTMRGKYVERRFGWDCHGLPIENIIEKEHNITDHKQIEAMGVGVFNDLCRGAVQRYTKEWRVIVERMGRWVDMDWDYRTMDPEYMESMWWAFKQLFDKELIYEGHKSMHICPRCVTPLSNFEVTQGYADRTDMSVIMTFPLKDDPKTVLLAWTTTPWSLPGNLWLLVGPDIHYVKVRRSDDDRTYILAEKLVESVFKKEEVEVIGAVKAKELEGLRYEPLFPYFVESVMPSSQAANKPVTYGDKCFKVLIDEMGEVSDEDGTGIVHITNSHGEDGFMIAQKQGVDILHHLNMDGSFKPECIDFAGLNAKPEGEDPMSTDKKVIAVLKENGRHLKSYTFTHSYPHCWRCDSPLLNYATGSWFVNVQRIKETMLENKDKTQWVPSHLRDGRFGNWLEGARDWAISRNRYWGTPLPVWRNEEGDIDVVGSRSELMDKRRIRFTKVTALRHGESEGNLVPLYQGELPGTDLTAEGRKQAEQTAEKLAAEAVDVIYCSPLARTRQTAQAIADRTGAKLIVDDRLREVRFGEYEGKTIDFSDLAFVKAKRAHKLETGSPESIYHFPGMETWQQVQDRVESFLKEMLPKHRSEHVVIVTHADPLQNIKHCFTGEDPMKISHQPYPLYADPQRFYWDHVTGAQTDLHKDKMDAVRFAGPSSEKSVKLLLIRHGETDWNKSGKSTGGNSDIPLNENGRAQAHALAASLKNANVDHIVTSDLARAVETAEILSKGLDVSVSGTWPELRERDTGDWSGKTVEEVLAEHPLPEKSAAHTTFHYATPPNGESLSAFLERSEAACKKLLREYPGKTVAVVCHGGTIRALRTVIENLGFAEASLLEIRNAQAVTIELHPFMERIPEVLDCWFESGSMPYAQGNFPFSGGGDLPVGFPANFIAEGVDQCRAWFYTLMVLSSAIFGETPYKNVVVNGIVLAEDGKKMSKRLKNYPDPMELVEKYGADAIRFTLMNSPAVRGEDLRMSERLVEDSMRSVLLPLWNTYSFFVTYANAAAFVPTDTRRKSAHPLDAWILAETQDLVNRMTEQLDRYDLSATCGELFDTVDALTNWYVRLSRRRFAGKTDDDRSAGEVLGDDANEDRLDALHTLHSVLLTLSQLLAPFCPYITEAIYLNLVGENHASVHLTDWPTARALGGAEKGLLSKTRLLRQITSLGLSLRSEKKIKNRQPLSHATVAVPESLLRDCAFAAEDLRLLRQELNVKDLRFTNDPGELAERYAKVDARKVGPRLGKRVQEVIAAGKAGDFTVEDDGTIRILEETLSPEEVEIVYRGREGEDIAADRGVVVSMNTVIDEDLADEGLARDIIRTVQRLRKESDLAFTDSVTLHIEGAARVTERFGDMISRETASVFGENDGEPREVDLDGDKLIVRFKKR